MASHGKPKKQQPPKTVPFAPPTDLRVTYTHAAGAQKIGNLDIPDGALILPIGKVELLDGTVVSYQGPNVVAFNLLEAREHQKRAAKLRESVLKQLKPADDGTLRVTNMTVLFDYLSDASTSVLMSYAAIEGFCNALIDNLADGTQVTVERKGLAVVYGKDEMARRLSTSEKLHIVAPIATGTASVKGTVPWEGFVRLRRLRDDLVHIKGFGYAGEASNPQAYGRLLRGEGDGAVQEAGRVVLAIQPDWIKEPVRKKLGL